MSQPCHAWEVLIAYVDESYDRDFYFIGAAVANIEQWEHLSDAYGSIRRRTAAEHGTDPRIEFHAHELMGGNGAWAQFRGRHREAAGVYIAALRASRECGVRYLFRGVDVAGRTLGTATRRSLTLSCSNTSSNRSMPTRSHPEETSRPSSWRTRSLPRTIISARSRGTNRRDATTPGRLDCDTSPRRSTLRPRPVRTGSRRSISLSTSTSGGSGSTMRTPPHRGLSLDSGARSKRCSRTITRGSPEAAMVRERRPRKRGLRLATFR